MRSIQIIRPGIGAMTQPIDTDDHALQLLATLAPLIPLDAEWSVVDAERLDYVQMPPAPIDTPTTTDRLSAAFG